MQNKFYFADSHMQLKHSFHKFIFIDSSWNRNLYFIVLFFLGKVEIFIKVY